MRQGCVLSPLLFNIFLSDLQQELDSCSDNVKIDSDTALSCLLWADDILILSESEVGLQKKLNALEKYCDINKLSVNTKKTQCMIFNSSGKLLKKHNFTYKGKPLVCVREYKYLGFIVTPSGEVRTGLEDLRKRALKAYAKMKSSLGILFRHNIDNTIHIYNYLVKPILTYCSDFWGCIQPKNNPIEKVHLMFCKHLLGVRKQTSTDGVLQELGMTPITFCALKAVVKNWERIQRGEANVVLTASNTYAMNNNLLWSANIRQLFNTNGLLQEYLRKINETEERRYRPIHEALLQRLNDQFHQASMANIASSRKMNMLSLVKTSKGRDVFG